MYPKIQSITLPAIRFFKSFLLGFVLLLLVTPDGLAAPFVQENSTKARAQALLDTLTPEERVGQLFLVTFTGTTAPPDSPIYDLIVNYHVGGVILQASNDNFAPAPQTLNQTIQLIRELQSREWTASQSRQIDPVTQQEFSPAFIPMFVGISQEGNTAPYDQILSGLTPLPSQMALGATWNPDLARETGAVLGAELSTLGFNLLLGPSLDVLENPRQQGFGDLGVRTFGGDPYWVGEMGRAFVNGVHTGSSNHIAVVAKHFPGHGSSDRLPEEEVATVRKSLEQLKRIELPPFYAVTGNAATQDDRVDALLASHIRYQGFQGNIRETTRPVSFDRQAFDGLMSLPPFASWRENGGVIISDDLGSRAFRRFIDPTGISFSPRFIARDAFLTGNDLLFVGKDFFAPTDPDSSETIKRSLAFFAQKYRDDPAFRQRVDESALRLLTLKYRLYDDIFSINRVLPSVSGLANLGKSGQVTFQVAQEAATLISPALTGLAETLPEPPNINDRIIFISDARTTQQCSQCPVQPVLATDALKSAVTRLYGPSAAGQVLPRNLKSTTFQELQYFLDGNEEVNLKQMEEDLRQSSWIVFAMLNVTTDLPSSQALSRFLAERPDLFRQKKMVVFAFDAPYYLDATEVSKLNAYFGLYSKTPPFIEVAARMLFGELSTPPGNLPVSVLGVDYDLISATAPDPAQNIQLFLDFPTEIVAEGTATPEPTPVLEFRVGDLIPVRTGVILDHNGHPVPDETPVTFVLNLEGELTRQTEYTRAGVARTTFLVNQSGTLEIHAESDLAQLSTLIDLEIPPEEGVVLPSTSTAVPTETSLPTVPPTLILTESATPAPATRDHTNLGDWFLALFVTLAFGGFIYWLTALFGIVRWGVRAGLLSLIGGLLAYTYLAIDLPGSKQLLADSGAWGVLLTTFLGSSLGWGAAWSWQRIDMSARFERTSTQQSREQADD